MSILDDIANWVIVDYLNRSDLQSIARTAAVDVYRMICAKVPFDQLMATSPEFAFVANQDTYVINQDWEFVPDLRAIANIRITFDASTKRRPRRSHVRVYDSLSFSSSSKPATYARWGNTLQFSPPPDSSSYTARFRYWSRPTIGLLTTVSAASWLAGTVTLTVGSNVGMTTADKLTLTGVNPSGYNVSGVSLTVSGSQITYPLTNNPGAYVSGGIANDTSVPEKTIMVTPQDYDELFKWETLYRVYHYIDKVDKAMALVQPSMMPRQASPKKTPMLETGIIPRLWNELMLTMSQAENVDEDFSINPVIRAYSVRR